MSFSDMTPYELELDELERTVPHAPARFSLAEFRTGIAYLSSTAPPSDLVSAESVEDKENSPIRTPDIARYTIDYADKCCDFVPPLAVSTPVRASDKAVAPFLEAAKKSTTILTRKAALKAQTQDKRQGKKVKRVKRADECKMTGRVLAKAPAPVIVHKLRGDEPNYEKVLQDDLASPHEAHTVEVPSWVGKSYNPEIADMGDGEVAQNAALVKKLHKSGDEYSDVKGILIPIEGVKYHRDVCALKDLKPKGCDERFTKFSKADFHGPAYYGAYFEEPEGTDDPVVQDKKIPKKVPKDVKNLNDKKVKEPKAPTNLGPTLDRDGVPTYCVSAPFAIRYIL